MKIKGVLLSIITIGVTMGLLLFHSGKADAQTLPALSSYVWNPQTVVDKSTVNSLLIQKATQAVEQMIQDRNGDGTYDHLAPLMQISGRTDQINWFYVNTAETILALSQIYPYVPSATQTKIRSFLFSEISNLDPTQADICQQWGNKPCFQDGVRREFAPIPPQNNSFYFHDICYQNLPDNPSGSCNPPANIANLYSLWAYGYYAGQWSFVSSNYNNIKSVYTSFKNQISNNASNVKYFPQIGGLIGYARIAQYVGDTTSANEAANLVTSVLQSMSSSGGFNRFRTNAEQTITGYDNSWTTDTYSYWTGYWTMPYFLYDFIAQSGLNRDIIYTSLFPEELGRFFHDYPNPNQEATVLLNQVQVFTPGWGVTLPDHTTVGENTYDMQETHLGMFKLHAYLSQENQSQLIKYIGGPASVGDLDYLQMLATAIQAPASGIQPSPTNTPIQPTNTPTPTSTPIPTYTISGNVYLDTNSNGSKDSGETNYSGATVTLSGGSTGSKTTDASGNYSFTVLTSGLGYTVSLTIPTGYQATTTNPVTVSLISNATANFGIVPTLAFGNGDTNGDSKVDVNDAKLVLSNYANNLTGAIDQYVDGTINWFDFANVANIIQGITPIPTSPTPTTPPAGSAEWTQFGHDPQRTSYTPQTVTYPWKLKWEWNGANSSGGNQSGHLNMSTLVQPVTGGGRVYVVAGDQVNALDKTTGAVIWSKGSIGTLSSTPVYDNGYLYIASGNNYLYKLNTNSSGATVSIFTADSALNLTPLFVNGTIYVVSHNGTLYSINTTGNMSQNWAYSGGSIGATPASYSSSKNLLVYLTQDLYVHAVYATTQNGQTGGQRSWRVKPTPRNYECNSVTGDSCTPAQYSNTGAQAEWGWPVIAEQHGIVFVKYRLEWNSIYDFHTDGPVDSSANIRTYLTKHPENQNLYALNLSNGSVAFIPAVGNTGQADNYYVKMGPQPIVRIINGQEVAYTEWKNQQVTCARDPGCWQNWDGNFGEMVLDNTTVSGYQAGDVRFIADQWEPADEKEFITMSGDTFYVGHWMVGAIRTISNRSAGLGGTYSNPIQTTNLTGIAWTADTQACTNNSSHYCSNLNYPSGGGRGYPYPGFYEYYNGTYDTSAPDKRSFMVVSDGLVIIKAYDGGIMALESGNPTGALSTQSNLAQANTASVLGVQTPVILPNPLNAGSFYGQEVSAEGVIAETLNIQPKAIYLNFGQFINSNHLHIKIPVKYVPGFTIDLMKLKGKKVQVTGKVTRCVGGGPEIVVSDPGQIQVLN